VQKSKSNPTFNELLPAREQKTSSSGTLLKTASLDMNPVALITAVAA
jgi:hypothetical protein